LDRIEEFVTKGTTQVLHYPVDHLQNPPGETKPSSSSHCTLFCTAFHHLTVHILVLATRPYININTPYRQGFIFFNLFFKFYSYVHTMFGSFLSPSPNPSLPGRNYFALISNFVEERV
jgi:hypothetical protein